MMNYFILLISVFYITCSLYASDDLNRSDAIRIQMAPNYQRIELPDDEYHPQYCTVGIALFTVGGIVVGALSHTNTYSRSSYCVWLFNLAYRCRRGRYVSKC